jgi:glycosyltransferase involved in cell wall biosynthesis
MKICMVTTAHRVDDDRIFFKEALSLAHGGHEVIMIGPAGGGEANVRAAGLECRPLKSHGTILSRLRALPTVIREIVRVKPDVCILHDLELVLVFPLLRLLTRAKLIYDSHELYSDTTESSTRIPGPLRGVTARGVDLVEKRLARLAHGIIGANEEVSARFARLGRPGCTIFNYPVLSLFRPDEEKVRALRARFEGRVPIVYHGGISESQGLFDLIGAMERIHERLPAAVLVLIGPVEPDVLERATAEIRARGLDGCIEHVAWVPHEEIASYVALARVGVIPFRAVIGLWWGTPIRLFEYMASGVPVVVSRLHYLAKYVEEAGCGLVHEPGNAEALAKAVLDLLQGKDGGAGMGLAGRRAVEEKWNWGSEERKLASFVEATGRGLPGGIDEGVENGRDQGREARGGPQGADAGERGAG